MKICRSRFSVLGSRFVFPPPRLALRRDLAGALAKAGRFGVSTAVALVALSSADAGQGAPTAGNRETGQTMYMKAGCETCHGTNGQGTAAGPPVAGTVRQMAAFIAYVRKPTGTMPPQGMQTVSDQALTDIYAFLRSVSASQAAPVPSAPAGRADAGAALYAKIGCYQCHANQAQGGAAGPRLGPDPIPFARFSQYIRNPTGDMPPYTDKVLSNQELADIYAFLQARPRPPAVDTIPQLAP
jgi:mono/diheme cytochrome c family protein